MTKRLFLVLLIVAGIVFVPYWVSQMQFIRKLASILWPLTVAKHIPFMDWLLGVMSIAVSIIPCAVIFLLIKFIRYGSLVLIVLFAVSCGQKKPQLMRLQQIIPINAWGSADGQPVTWKQAADSSTFMCIVHEVTDDDRKLYNYHLVKFFYRDLEKDSVLYHFTSVLYSYADAHAAYSYSFNDDDSIPGLQQKTEIRARNAMIDFLKYDIYLSPEEHDNFLWTTLKVKLKQ